MVVLFIFCCHPRVWSISSVIKQISYEDNYHVPNEVGSWGILINAVPATLLIRWSVIIFFEAFIYLAIISRHLEHSAIMSADLYTLSLSNQDWMTQWPDFQGIRFQFLRKRRWFCFLPILPLGPSLTFGADLKQYCCTCFWGCDFYRPLLFIVFLPCEPVFRG